MSPVVILFFKHHGFFKALFYLLGVFSPRVFEFSVSCSSKRDAL